MAATTWVFELRSDGETRRGAGGQAGKVWVRTIGGLMPVKIVALGGFLVSTIDQSCRAAEMDGLCRNR
jgi:hypothetical protein